MPRAFSTGCGPVMRTNSGQARSSSKTTTYRPVRRHWQSHACRASTSAPRVDTTCNRSAGEPKGIELPRTASLFFVSRRPILSFTRASWLVMFTPDASGTSPEFPGESPGRSPSTPRAPGGRKSSSCRLGRRSRPLGRRRRSKRPSCPGFRGRCCPVKGSRRRGRAEP